MSAESRADFFAAFAAVILLMNRAEEAGAVEEARLDARDGIPFIQAQFVGDSNKYTWVFDDQVAAGLLTDEIQNQRAAFENAAQSAIYAADDVCEADAFNTSTLLASLFPGAHVIQLPQELGDADVNSFIAAVANNFAKCDPNDFVEYTATPTPNCDGACTPGAEFYPR